MTISVYESVLHLVESINTCSPYVIYNAVNQLSSDFLPFKGSPAEYVRFPCHASQKIAPAAERSKQFLD